MIIKQLYESLVNSLNEARINRTIDRKLWLTVASICSRNKSTNAEFIKPLSKMSKDEILQRYVAALLIMKKPCPKTEQDIESIKTFKLFGQKFISLNGTIDDIKKLYIENGGSGVSIETTSDDITQEEKKLENDIKKPTEQQVEEISDKSVNIEELEDNENIDELPDGINTFDLINKYVHKKYSDITELIEQIYEILNSTNFYLMRTFHKIKIDKNNILYFNTVTIDKLKTIYIKSTKEFNISWIKCNNKKIRNKEEGNISVILNNMTINNNPISNNIKLTDNIYISKDQFREILLIILAKLLYIKQEKYDDLFNENKKNKEIIKTPLGSFNTNTMDINKPIDSNILKKIFNALGKKYYNYKVLYGLLAIFLEKYQLGNKQINGKYTAFKLNDYYFETNAGPGGKYDSTMKIYVDGIEYTNNINITGKYKVPSGVYNMRFYIYKDTIFNEEYKQIYYSMGDKYKYPYINIDTLKNILISTLTYFLYYTDNYDLLIK